MNYLILSDLHIGSPLCTKLKELSVLLNDSKYDKVIFNGDTIDIWEDDYINIVGRFSGFINDVNALEKEVIIIHGNHDPEMDVLQSIFPKCSIVNNYEIREGSISAIIVHGDEFDDIIKEHLWISKLTYYIHCFFERFGISLQAIVRNAYHSFLLMKNKEKKYNSIVTEVEKAAVKKYGRDYNHVILGHTHLPKFVGQDNCVYINIGDMTHSYSCLTLINGKFEFLKL